MKNVLVIAAHPDDEILGCGGTIARHRQDHDNVHIVLMADGVTSRTYDPLQKQTRSEELIANRDAIVMRQNEAKKAANVLSIDQGQVHFLNFPDQRLDSVPLLDLIKGIERIKAQESPDIVYTHFMEDLNMDHCLTARAVLTAFRPSASKEACPVYHFEVPESTSLSASLSGRFKPNHFVDITATLEKKLQALQAYESEKREYPDLRSAQYIKEHAQKRNVGRKGKYTEAFQINEMYSMPLFKTADQ